MALVDDRQVNERRHREFNRSVTQSPRGDAASQKSPRRRAWGKRYATRLMITDIAVITCSTFAVDLAQVEGAGGGIDTGSGLRWLLFTGILAGVWLAGLALFGSRDAQVTGVGAEEYKRVANATFALAGSVAVMSYLLQLDLPRRYLVLMVPVGLVALLVSRFAWRRWLHLRRDLGHMSSRVLAVGDLRSVQELLGELQRSPRAGYRIVGACVECEAKPEALPGVPVLGPLSEVARVARELDVDAVAVTSSGSFWDRAGKAALLGLGGNLDRAYSGSSPYQCGWT